LGGVLSGPGDAARPEAGDTDERAAADVGASRRALRLARTIDRVCRVPGRYVIVIDVPAHRRAEWSVEVARLEIIARWAAGRE
jgi:hypothetical protein